MYGMFAPKSNIHLIVCMSSLKPLKWLDGVGFYMHDGCCDAIIVYSTVGIIKAFGNGQTSGADVHHRSITEQLWPHVLVYLLEQLEQPIVSVGDLGLRWVIEQASEDQVE